MISAPSIPSPPRHIASLWLAFALAVPSIDLATTAAATETTTPTSRPNVLLIMTDDQGWGDIHAHDNPDIDTPHLDALAASGASFDRFYVSPVCAPTRAALLTGRYHPRTGVHGVTRGEENMRSDERTMAEILGDAGYRSGIFGKWHNGANYPHDPQGQGFDEFLGFCAGHWDLYFDSPLRHNQSMTRGTDFIIDHLTDQAIKFIQPDAGAKDVGPKGDDSEQPWFCYVPYNTPHTPWQVPEAFWRKYQGRGLDPTTACAYAMVENIDTNVGRLLESLERSGQREQTLVLFLTDNGANTNRWDGNMRGQKGSLHEGGTRVPLFVSWPGTIPANTTLPVLAAHIDLLPTVLEFAGVPIPESPAIDGRSLHSWLTQGNDPNWQPRTLFTHWKELGAARTPRWRLVQNNRRNPRWMLFDMQADPAETTDVADQHPEVTKRLTRAYEQWWADVSADGFDPIPTQIGHAFAPTVRLRGHEARLSPQGISYFGRNGWANDWISQWSDHRGSAHWPIQVEQPGTYRVRLRYAAPPNAVGDELVIRAGQETLRWKIDQPHIPDPIPTRDRLPRKETAPRTWRTVEIGTLRLGADVAKLQLERTTDGAPIDIKALELSP